MQAFLKLPHFFLTFVHTDFIPLKCVSAPLFSTFLYSVSKLPHFFLLFDCFLKPPHFFLLFQNYFLLFSKNCLTFSYFLMPIFLNPPRFFLLFAGFLYFLIPLLRLGNIFSYKIFFIFVIIPILREVVVSAPLFPTFLFPYFLMFSSVLPHFFLHLHLFYKTTIITNRKEEYVYGF